MSATYTGTLISDIEKAVARNERRSLFAHHTEEPAYSPIERIAVRLHGRFTDHDDPPSGLAKDCPKCLEAALDVMNIAVLSLGGEE